jgi:hypothetical protein
MIAPLQVELDAPAPMFGEDLEESAEAVGKRSCGMIAIRSTKWAF